MINIQYGFQVIDRSKLVRLNEDYREIIKKKDTYLSVLLNEVQSARISADDGLRNWFPFDIDDRIEETKVILESLIEEFNDENIFLKEYYLHREVYFRYTQIWYLRPYFFFTDNNLLTLLSNYDVFSEIIELTSDSSITPIEFLPECGTYIYPIPSKKTMPLKNILSDRNKKIKQQSDMDNMIEFCNLVKDLNENNQLLISVE